MGWFSRKSFNIDYEVDIKNLKEEVKNLSEEIEKLKKNFYDSNLDILKINSHIISLRGFVNRKIGKEDKVEEETKTEETKTEETKTIKSGLQYY